MTPTQYLARHEMTLRLKRLRVTKKQLDGVSYRRSEGSEFRDWMVVSKVKWPDKLLHERDVWCALRWLVMDNPPESRDKRDAWEFVSVELKKMFEGQARSAKLQAGRDKANHRRKAAADQKAVDTFKGWETAAATQIARRDADQRLLVFFHVRKIGEYAQRRYRRLRSESRI
jgi:hypothetical protein